MRRSTCALSLFTVFVVSVLSNAQDYSLTKLPTLGGKRTRAFAINEKGQIAGVSATSTNSRAFLWTRIGGIEDLGSLDGSESVAYAINSLGQVVGSSSFSCYSQVAFLWDPTNGMETLGSLDGTSSIASAINSSEEVVGVYSATDARGFLWTPVDGMLDLGTLGCVKCLPGAINDSGQVVGSAVQPDGSTHAFLWTQADGMKDLGTLGGANSSATRINNAGQIVGFSDTATGVQHAFLWSAGTGLQDLGTLPDKSYSWAMAISEAGRVVGSSWNPGRNLGKPFSWTQTDGMRELGPYGGHKVISSADGLNMAGQILVSAYNAGYSSYLVTPVMHTTLSSSPNPSQSGKPVILTAVVSSAVQGAPPEGEMVTFKSGGTVLGAVPLSAGVGTLTVSPKSTISIRAVYGGDSNFAPSESKLLKQVVLK